MADAEQAKRREAATSGRPADPCRELAAISLACATKHGDKKKTECKKEFDAYRDCRAAAVSEASRGRVTVQTANFSLCSQASLILPPVPQNKAVIDARIAARGGGCGGTHQIRAAASLHPRRGFQCSIDVLEPLSIQKIATRPQNTSIIAGGEDGEPAFRVRLPLGLTGNFVCHPPSAASSKGGEETHPASLRSSGISRGD